MEVFVAHVPRQSTDRMLTDSLKPKFLELGIPNVHVHIHKSRQSNVASLTFLHIYEAEHFLKHHGQHQRSRTPINRALYKQLSLLDQPIYCRRSDRPADAGWLGVLAREEKLRRMKAEHTERNPQRPSVLPILFDSTAVSCGIWSYSGSNLFYEPQCTWNTEGTVKFGEHSMILKLGSRQRIDFQYRATDCIVTDDGPNPCLIFSMKEAPRFYGPLSANTLSQIMGGLDLSGSPKKAPDRERLPGLDEKHKLISGLCFVYRVALSKDQITAVRETAITHRMNALRNAYGLPTFVQRRISVVLPRQTVAAELQLLQVEVASLNQGLPFEVVFQLKRLALDAYLPPRTVLKLIPEVQAMLSRSTIPICVHSIRRLFSQVPLPGPQTESTDFEVPELVKLLQENENMALEWQTVEEEKRLSSNVVMVHKVRVTPAGIYLSGPEQESNNRILRKYPDCHSNFIRLDFSDEDGQGIHFNQRVSTQCIHFERFKDIFRNGVPIGDRKYDFLGYSNSALKSHSVWFVAPFLHEGNLMYEKNIIQHLGDFRLLTSPAKFGARIGQAFSDTRIAIDVSSITVIEIPDVVRNGRTFSDGCGTMSLGLLNEIWEVHPKARVAGCTVFQIRYQGYKGMISLNKKLEGRTLALRPSMRKFDGTGNMLEICGSASKPLGLFLNRQSIKIMEDLGVSDDFFINLQDKEVQRLRSIVDTPINASNFLKRHGVGIPFHFPWLLSELARLDIDFNQDPFISNTLQMTLLMELRNLKYRGRIPVEDGRHLYGIMDEYGVLEEGEICCSYMQDGIQRFVTGDKIFIIRPPSLHCGDIQFVKCIEPSLDSPLRDNPNCIQVSSKGSRDLPSKLGGGDLDGDFYSVLWDRNAYTSKSAFAPGEYPSMAPIDFGRPITTEDRSDFVLDVMISDQIGRIAIHHLVLADLRPAGTDDEDCKNLSMLHSAAVDFPKTGHKPDMTLLPRNPGKRPDFKASGPHVKIEKLGSITFTSNYEDPDAPVDEDEDFPKYRYYESQKINGKLFRRVPEREVFEQVKAHAKIPDNEQQSIPIATLWVVIQMKCPSIPWEGYMDWARSVRREYEQELVNIIMDNSADPAHPVTELEVFIGNILGKTGAATKPQREKSKTMKDQFEEHSVFIADWILKHGPGGHENALARCMACVATSLEDFPPFPKHGHIHSFKYAAAGLCWKEIDRLSL